MDNQSIRGISVWLVIALLAGGVIGYMLGGRDVLTKQNANDVALRLTMRKLWSDHVIWTRQYIVLAVMGRPDSPDSGAAAARLLKNQDEIGAAVAAYYGKDAGDKLAGLLRQHIMIAVDLVTAAKSGNQAKLTDADKRWHTNADDIAAFLSSANPNWPKNAVRDMLYRHLSLTTQEAVARINQNWAGDVQAFDQIFDQAMMMADVLTDGIVKQFPGKF